MKATNKTLALAIGGAFVASIAATSVHAAENPFALKSLSSGYMLADADKMKDGKCGTGKCSAAKMKAMKDGSCSGDKAKEASCYAAKSTENVCGVEATCAAQGTCSAGMMKTKAKDMTKEMTDKVKGSMGRMKEGSCSADKAKEGTCNH